MRRSLVVILLALATPAYAQDAGGPLSAPTDPPKDPPPEPVSPAEPEQTEAPPEVSPAPETPARFDATKPDTDGTAPPADRASGITVAEQPDVGDRALWIPRVLLFVPRWTLWVIAQPFRGAAWAFEHYQLQTRVKGLLFNWDGTYGVYPVGTYSTDFGFDIGLRFVHKNLFGKNEHLRLKVNFGGRYQQGYGIELKSGNRFGKRFNATLDATYERRPNERFFGIGNANELDEVPTMPLDPTQDASIIDSRFRENWFRAVVRLEAKLFGNLSFRAASALALREFANFEGSDPFDSSDPMEDAGRGIAERFDTTKIIGFDRGVKNIYNEGELIYDSRRPSTRYQPTLLDSTGWYAAAHLGHADGVDGDPTSFWRYGGEVQRFFDLYNGSRILTLRVLVDAVYGGDGRTDETVSFIDLPRLGGTEFLRGYPNGRFRDRAITLATAEYTWDLGNFYAAYLFVDGGRAYNTLEDYDPDSLHVGFGGGIQLHTSNTFLLRAQLAFSREGNVFAELAFSPSFGRRERAGRF